jgi:TPR repeat protein
MALVLAVLIANTFLAPQWARAGETEKPAQKPEMQVLECKNETASACYQRGLKLSGSRNPIEQRHQALSLLRSSCEQDFASACYRLGIIFSLDHELRDLPAALAGFQRACELGHLGGCWDAGSLLRKPRAADEGLAQDCRRAIGFYERVCSGGDGSGCMSLSEMYATGCGDVAKDDRKSKKYLKLGRRLLRDDGD